MKRKLVLLLLLCGALVGCGNEDNHHRNYNSETAEVASEPTPEEPTPTETPKEKEKVLYVYDTKDNQASKYTNYSLTDTGDELIIHQEESTTTFEKVNVANYVEKMEEKE